MTDDKLPLVISAPHPRTLDLIFSPAARRTLHSRYRIVELEPEEVGGLDRSMLAEVRYVIGQPPLSRPARAYHGGQRRVPAGAPAGRPSRSRIAGLPAFRPSRGGARQRVPEDGRHVLEDMELMDRGLPPLRCKRADALPAGGPQLEPFMLPYKHERL